MAGCVLPLLVSVVLVAVASNSRVMFRGKWTQMIERLFFFFGEQSERVRGERWEAFCQMMDSQRLNDLCTLLKRQTGC